MAYSNGYKHRKLITIDYTKVGEFAGHFRMLLSHTDAALKTVANGGYVHKNPLLDIRFEDMSGNKLAHEMTSYNGATGEINAWVKLDSVSHTVNTTFWMYFGKDLTASSYQGIRIGYESATKVILERNTINGLENQGEITPYIAGMTDPDGGSITQPSTGPIVGRDDGAGEGLTTGWLMYSVADVPSRFGLSKPTWNDHLILVRYSDGQWYYDNNSTISNTFTPVSTDFLIAEVSWNHPTTGRAQNYIGKRPAGEERPWHTWADAVTTDDDIGVVSNNYSCVVHMNTIPETTYSVPDNNRFSMNFLSEGSMDSSDLVAAKFGKGLDFDGSNDLLRAKKDVIWTASGVGYISFWFKVDTASATCCLFSRRNGVHSGDSNNIFLISGALRADFNSSSSWYTGWTASPDTWYHVVVQTDGTTRRLYVNGSQVATQSSAVGWDVTGNYHHVQIGASVTNSTASGHFFDGIISEFRHYRAAREAGFHLAEYNNQNSPGTFYSVGTMNTHMDANETSHGHVVDGGLDLTQHLTAVVADALHSHAVDSINIIENKTLSVDDTLHALFFASIDVPLQPDESAHQVSSDIVTLLQKHNLIVSDTTHSVSMDGTVLTVKVFLEGNLDSLHIVAFENPNLIQQFFLIASKAYHRVKSSIIQGIINWTALKFFKGKYKDSQPKNGELASTSVNEGSMYKSGSYKAGGTNNGNYF